VIDPEYPFLSGDDMNKFVENDLQPLKVCVIDANAATIAGYPVPTGSEYEAYEYEEVYYKGLLYYHPSCNGLNSFCDIKNLYFGDEYVSKPKPELTVVPNLMTRRGDCDSYGLTND